jgi:hypothetical protein
MGTAKKNKYNRAESSRVLSTEQNNKKFKHRAISDKSLKSVSHKSHKSPVKVTAIANNKNKKSIHSAQNIKVKAQHLNKPKPNKQIKPVVRLTKSLNNTRTDKKIDKNQKVKPADISRILMTDKLPREQPRENSIIVTAPEKTKRLPDHWSECGQIFFTHGKAFGISPNLRTIYIGQENDIESYLLHGKLNDGLTHLQKDILSSIKAIRKSRTERCPEDEKKPISKSRRTSLVLESRQKKNNSLGRKKIITG